MTKREAQKKEPDQATCTRYCRRAKCNRVLSTAISLTAHPHLLHLWLTARKEVSHPTQSAPGRRAGALRCRRERSSTNRTRMTTSSRLVWPLQEAKLVGRITNNRQGAASTPRSLSNNEVRHRCSRPRRASLTSRLAAKESSSSSPHNNKYRQSILRIRCGRQERSNSSSTKKTLKELPETENIPKKREAISARSSY